MSEGGFLPDDGILVHRIEKMGDAIMHGVCGTSSSNFAYIADINEYNQVCKKCMYDVICQL